MKRPSKAKAPARPTKRTKPSSSPPADSSPAERRRSGRGAGAKSYADRDDIEDEQEMMEGVSKWRYSDDDSDAEMRDESGDAEEGDQASEEEAADPEVEAEVEDEDNKPEAETTPTATPPKVNGKSAAKKAVPLRAKAVPQTKAKAAPKAKTKVKPKAKPAATTKGKGKAAVKDVYDFDDSD